MRYKAFISYRHCEPDSVAAEKIIKVVETYGIPKTIAQKHHIEKRVGKLFRDEDELAAADNLSVAITNALDESEFLIMICSPRYIESEWCMLEIQHWINRNGRKNIIAVLLEGEPSESFPKLLTDYDENGKHIHIEPLAVDIRGESKKEILKNIDLQKFRIISSLIGCNYDDLRQRQQERARKNTAAIFAAAFSVLSVIIAIILGANVRLSEQNDLIAEQYEELEEKNDEISNANNELEQKNNELIEANRATIAANAETFDQLAEAKSYLGNKIAAAEAEMSAYKLASSAEEETDRYFKRLLDYIDVYSVKPAQKLLSRHLDINDNPDPSYITIIGNEQYYIIQYFQKIYCYSIEEDEMLQYNELDTSLKKLIMLDGPKYAAIYSGYENNEAGELNAYFIVTVTDFKSGKEYSYKGEGYYTDAVLSDGMIRLLVENISGKFMTFDLQCRLIESFDTETYPKQILDNDNVLEYNSILNVRTGERIRVGLQDYRYYNSTVSDFKYSAEEQKYVYDNSSYQYSYAVWTQGALLYNTINNDNIPNTYNIVNGITGETAFDGPIENSIRFAANAENALIAYTDNDYNITLLKIGDSSKVLTFKNDMPVRKLVLSDKYLIAVFYDKEPEIYCFDPETLYLYSSREFEEKYIDAVISGRICYMLSYEEKKADVFLLNDFSEIKAINAPCNSTDNLYYHNAAEIDDVKIFLNERGSDIPPEYVFINIDGTVLGSFTPEKNYLRYDEEGNVTSFSLFTDNDAIFSMYTSPPWFLPRYKELLNNPEKIMESIVYLDGERGSYHYNENNLFISFYNKDNLYSGAIYDLSTGELLETVDFFSNDTTDFCTYGNIRAEYNYKEIKIYEGTELVNTITPEYGSNLRVKYLNDPEIIVVEDNSYLQFYSLSQQKPMLKLELLKSSLRVKEKSLDGKNYILVNSQYLIDKDNWTVIHDFGLESLNADAEDFYFNKKIGMWGISGWNGNITDITFFCNDTFEEAYTIPDCLALSPDGSYVYKINQQAKSTRAILTESGFWCMPLLTEEEILQKLDEMLDIFKE